MKRFTLLTGLWLITTFCVFAQDWTTQLGGTGATTGVFPGENTIVATAADASENIFALIVFRGTLTLGSTVYTAPGNSSSFNPKGLALVKYSSAGSVLWSVPLSNADSKLLNAYKLAIDANGDALIGGEYLPYFASAAAAELDFGGGKTVSKSYQIVVAKYNGIDGACTFVKPFDITAQNRPTRTLSVFGVDNSNNIYIATAQQGGLVDEGSTLRKLDNNGNIVWTVDNGVGVQLNAGTVDANGNVIAQAGLGTSSVQPSQFTLATEVYPYAYKGYSVMASFDQTGVLKWTKVFKNTGAIYSQALDIDVAGNIYFIHGDNINNASDSPYGVLSDTGNGNYALVKLDVNGTLQNVVYRSFRNFNGMDRKIAINKSTGDVYLYQIYSAFNTNPPLLHGDLVYAGANNNSYLSILRYNSNLVETGGYFGIYAAALGVSNPLVQSTLAGKLIISGNINIGVPVTIGASQVTGTKNKDGFISIMQSPTFIQGVTTTWLGNTNDWNIGSNWSNGIPAADKKAVIPAGLGKYPTTFPATPTIGIFEVSPGVTLTAIPTDLKVTGAFKNNGNISLSLNNSSSAITFTGFGIDVEGNGTMTLTASGYAAFNWNTAYAIKQKLILNSNVQIALNSNMSANELQLMGNAKIYTGTGSYQVKVLSNSPTALSGFDNSRYIYGTGGLYRSTTTSGVYDFPLGDVSYYHPSKITFTDNTSVGYLVAKYASTAPTPAAPPASCTVNGEVITGYLSGLGTWTFTPNVAMSAGSYNIEIVANVNTATAADKIALIKRVNSSSPWMGLGNWVLSVKNTSSFPNTVTAKLTGLTSFSDFAFGVSSNGIQPAVLPVKLVQFAAKAQNNAVSLNWQTTNEQNNKGFIIYRSGNDKQFVEIGKVEATSVLNFDFHTYSYLDQNPFKGNNYYKLIQLDNDGKVTELGIRTVSFGLSAVSTQLYPNPSSTYFSVVGNTSQISKVSIADLSGKIVSEIANPSEKITLPNVSSGIFVIKVTCADGTVSKHKLIVEK